MKFLLLFAFVVIVVAKDKLKSDLTDVAVSLSKLFKVSVTDAQECIKKSEANMEDMRYLEENMFLEYSEITDKESLRKASCAFVCCAQKRGYMIGAEMQLDKLFNKLLAGVLTKDTIMRDFATDCKSQVKNQTDECIYGYEFVTCMYKKDSTLEETE